jgi:hypothetical protein
MLMPNVRDLPEVHHEGPNKLKADSSKLKARIGSKAQGKKRNGESRHKYGGQAGEALARLRRGEARSHKAGRLNHDWQESPERETTP